MQAVSLYLDIMKKALTFFIWDEPLIPIEMMEYSGYAETFLYKERIPDEVRQTMQAIDEKIKPLGFRVATPVTYGISDKLEGKSWPMSADTMIGMKRLDNIQYCFEYVLNNGIEGDMIETGIWRGGACIFMRAILSAYGIKNRKIFAADSFEGLPKPDKLRYPVDEGDEHYKYSFLSVSLEDVKSRFEKYGLLDDQVIFLKGWFKDTLPVAPIDKLAVMRLDGDMYGSTMEALSSLYPKLSQGGFCIIDDFAMKGCRQAAEDFRNNYQIRDPIIPIDWMGAYWQKT